MSMRTKYTGGGESHPKEVTGRMVFVCLVAFFAVVAGVNFVLVKAAISTFGGLETDSSYRAGLAYGREIAAAEAQKARYWRVEAKVLSSEDGTTVVDMSVQDAAGQPIAGLGAVVRLAHPTDRRLDHALTMHEDAPGRFRGNTTQAKGEWDVVIELSRGEERLFRSKNRISVH
jgi:nitrogen fixation protein FixH